ncbi:Electron transport complex, RnfABCDGE type, E subunit [Alteracholeplasma palmae J233]|uniref:Electron transport complex, RnfABCDGE type, E subunit n=1 Tax=Alteracholeplasma palmae (strain ATCC 49389 / J233) TaxID=1318466 RepID=U4KQP7_ALTPJ|nr:Rnf-Nqr domain containing protein [Alteracholeplasma palmae]CCV64950.1 Electron transport complex, RnfABCDGE type, E subunit [Alteracholeplasma palmae J233]
MKYDYLKNQTFAVFFSMMPILLIATSFEKGLISAIILFVISIVTTLIAYFLKDNLKGTHRTYAYIILVAMQMTIVGLLLKLVLPNDITNSGLYLSLFIINIVVIGYAELVSDRMISLKRNIQTSLLTFIVILIVSLLREVLGTGSIQFSLIAQNSISIFDSKYAISLLVDISGGFIITGIVAAIAFALFSKKEGEGK